MYQEGKKPKKLSGLSAIHENAVSTSGKLHQQGMAEIEKENR